MRTTLVHAPFWGAPSWGMHHFGAAMHQHGAEVGTSAPVRNLVQNLDSAKPKNLQLPGLANVCIILSWVDKGDQTMNEFQRDQADWWADWKDEEFDYPYYPDYPVDPSNFDLDIPF